MTHERRGTHPFLRGERPVLMAHRGGAAEAPENSAAAIARLASIGVRYLETDAHASKTRRTSSCERRSGASGFEARSPPFTTRKLSASVRARVPLERRASIARLPAIRKSQVEKAYDGS